MNKKQAKISIYLSNAKQKVQNKNERLPKLSKQKDVISQTKNNIFIRSSSKQGGSKRDSTEKSKRSLSGSNLPFFRQIRNSSSLNSALQPNLNMVKKSVEIKKRNGSQEERIISKWRKSYSGLNLNKMSSSKIQGTDSLFHRLNQDKQTRKIQLKKPQNRQLPAVKKSLSLSKTKSIYSSIKQYNRQQQFWAFHLQQQLSLKQTIQQFQKIQLNINIQPTKKITLRQAHQLKKQVILQINQQDAVSIQKNIQKLAQIALDQKQKGKFLMIGFFISIRDRLKLDKGDKQKHRFAFKREVIQDIKAECQSRKRYRFQDPNIITIKILSVLALHLLKLESPKFSARDIELITETIRLKKKGHRLIDYLGEAERRVYFQSLIYLVFQFYKNLYYLNLDEELKIEHYDLLRAYLSLYQAKDVLKFKVFQEKYRINSTLQTMKPVSAGIFAYQDSRARGQIRIKNLQKQLNDQSQNEAGNNQSRRPRIKINKRTFLKHFNDGQQKRVLNEISSYSSDQLVSKSDISSEQESSAGLSSRQQLGSLVNYESPKPGVNRQSIANITSSKKGTQKNDQKAQSINLSILRTKKPVSNKLKLSLTKKAQTKVTALDRQLQKCHLNKQMQVGSLNQQNFCFPFLLCKQASIYRGQFCIQLRNDFTILDFAIKIVDCKGDLLLSYRFKGIRNYLQTINSANFRKLLWKVFKKIFVMNFMDEQDPFLMKQINQDRDHLKQFVSSLVPGNELQTIEVIHDYLVYWLKETEFDYKFIGRTIDLPRFNPQQINKYMENLEFQHDRKMFVKRQGYLHSNSVRGNASLFPLSSNAKVNAIFNEIQNTFVLQDKSYLDQQNEKKEGIKCKKNMLLLLKIHNSERNQLKFVRMLFWKHVREIHIFEIGLYRHLNTRYIQQKIPIMRSIQNSQNLTRLRLILQVQNLLKSVQKRNLYFHEDISQTDQSFQRQHKIQQQFEVDLTGQSKFIPTINLDLVRTVDLTDFQQILIRREKLQKRRSKSKFKNKLLRNLSKSNDRYKNQMDDFDSFEGNALNDNLVQITNPSLLKTFKISSFLFLAVQFKFGWGKRFLCLQNSLEFFQVKAQLLGIGNNFKYRFQRISIYQLGIKSEQKINKIGFQDNWYLFFNAKKPYLSKFGKRSQQISNQYFLKKVNKNPRNRGSVNYVGISQSLTKQKLKYIEQKIFFTLKVQKILKFKLEGKVEYYSFQIYKPIQQQALGRKQHMGDLIKKLFIYQLTNFRKADTKFYLATNKLIECVQTQQLTKSMDFNNMTLMGEKMQSFRIPVHKIDLRNSYYQKKTKYVRQKIISEANYYFEQKILKLHEQPEHDLIKFIIQTHKDYQSGEQCEEQ